MPHKGLVERGYAKAKIYQTHGAATMDLIRVGGADVEGSFVLVRPGRGRREAARLEREQGARRAVTSTSSRPPTARARRTSSAAHAFDVVLVLQKAVPIALKKGKPGTPEFRAALKDAFETMGRTPVSQGVLNWTADRSLRLHAGDRRDAEGGERRLAGRAR